MDTKQYFKFEPTQRFSLWHDRAVFHFLTSEKEIEQYINLVNDYAQQYVIIATFSNNGPKKCSGLPVQQYSLEQLQERFAEHFTVKDSFYHNHTTPSGNTQNFLYCLFERNA